MATLPHLTQKEQEKLAVITDAISGKITKTQASLMLGISTRQVKRLKRKILEHGSLAIIHRLKGRSSNHHINPLVKEDVLDTIENTMQILNQHLLQKNWKNIMVFISVVKQHAGG